MEDREPNSHDIYQRIREAIWKKLEAHRDTIKRSPNHGRISWRLNPKKDTVDVDFDLTL